MDGGVLSLVGGEGWLSRLVGYYLETLKNSRSASLGWTINILRGRTHAFVDVAALCDEEPLLSSDRGEVSFRLHKQLPKVEVDVAAGEEEEGAIESEFEPDPDREHAFARLRTMAQRNALNPYEREFLYAYPFVVGLVRNERICAPLFTVPCSVESDLQTGEVIAHLLADELEANMRLWGHILPEGDQRLLQEKVFRDTLMELPLDSDELLALFQRLRNAFPPLMDRCPSEWHWHLSPLADLKNWEQKGIRIVSCAAVIWTVRVHHYLRADLEALVNGSAGNVDESVLRLFSPDFLKTPYAIQTRDHEVEPAPLEELVFPLKSNPDQRRVAKALEHHSLIVVQGPPGTGKSETIANLICHLVAQGKTVLLSSQKNKALEVVAERLNNLGIKYLAMTLLRGDKESRQRLVTELQTLDGYLQQYPASVLEGRRKQLNGELTESQRHLSAIQKEFEKQWQEERDKSEKYRQFHVTRKDDLFPTQALVPDGDENSLASALTRYAQCYAQCSQLWQKLTSWSERLKVFHKKINWREDMAQWRDRWQNWLAEAEALCAELVDEQEVIDCARRLWRVVSEDVCHLDAEMERLKIASVAAQDAWRAWSDVSDNFGENSQAFQIAERLERSNDIYPSEPQNEFLQAVGEYARSFWEAKTFWDEFVSWTKSNSVDLHDQFVNCLLDEIRTLLLNSEKIAQKLTDARVRRWLDILGKNASNHDQLACLAKQLQIAFQEVERWWGSIQRLRIQSGEESLKAAQRLSILPEDLRTAMASAFEIFYRNAQTALMLPRWHPRCWLAQRRALSSIAPFSATTLKSATWLRVLNQRDIIALESEYRKLVTILEHADLEARLDKLLGELAYPILNLDWMRAFSDWQSLRGELEALEGALWVLQESHAILRNNLWATLPQFFEPLKRALKTRDVSAIEEHLPRCKAWLESLPAFAKALRLEQEKLHGCPTLLAWTREQMIEVDVLPDDWLWRLKILLQLAVARRKFHEAAKVLSPPLLKP